MPGIYARSIATRGYVLLYAPVGPSAGISRGTFVGYARSQAARAKCPVCMRVVTLARGKVLVMLARRFTAGEVSGVEFRSISKY